MTPREAAHIAYSAHAGQSDKAGRPYIAHVARVVGQQKANDDDAIVVAYLHDVVEDHGDEWPVFRLEVLGLTEAQRDALVAITRQPHEDYGAYMRRVRENPLARRVKFYDLMDNLRPERLDPLDVRTKTRLMSKYLFALEQLYLPHI